MSKDLIQATLADIGDQLDELQDRSGLSDATPENNILFDLIPQIARLTAMVDALSKTGGEHE